ncbi:hypothetical protein QTP86_014025, partial [Hemibagrus guttatus]
MFAIWYHKYTNSQVVSTFASHLQGWVRFPPPPCVCGVCMFSLCLGGFLR